MKESILGLKFIGNDEEPFIQKALKRFEGVPGGVSYDEYRSFILWSLRELNPEQVKDASNNKIIDRFNKIARLYLPDDALAYFHAKNLIDENFHLTTLMVDIFKSLAPHYKRIL